MSDGMYALSDTHRHFQEQDAIIHDVVSQVEAYRTLLLARHWGADCAIRSGYVVTRPRPPVHFVCQLPEFFPPELWLRIALRLTPPDLISLRGANRSLSRLFVHQTHKCLVLRFPDRGYSSIVQSDITDFVAKMELAMTAFAIRNDICGRVEKVVFEGWPLNHNPVFFNRHFKNVQHVAYRGSTHRTMNVPSTHSLPNTVTRLELRHVTLEHNALHHLVGPSAALKMLNIFACAGGGITPITPLGHNDSPELTSWFEANGVRPPRPLQPSDAEYSVTPNATLTNVVLDFTCVHAALDIHTQPFLHILRCANFQVDTRTMSDVFAFPCGLPMTAVTSITLGFLPPELPFMYYILKECQDTLKTLSLSIEHDRGDVGHPDNYFPVLPALQTLDLNCYPETLEHMVFVLSDMCFSQPVDVHLSIHPSDEPATIGTKVRVDARHEKPRRIRELPNIPDMWRPADTNRHTPFVGNIVVKRPCGLENCWTCPKVLVDLSDLLNHWYPPLPHHSDVFQVTPERILKIQTTTRVDKAPDHTRADWQDRTLPQCNGCISTANTQMVIITQDQESTTNKGEDYRSTTGISSPHSHNRLSVRDIAGNERRRRTDTGKAKDESRMRKGRQKIGGTRWMGIDNREGNREHGPIKCTIRNSMCNKETPVKQASIQRCKEGNVKERDTEVIPPIHNGRQRLEHLHELTRDAMVPVMKN
ncbi:hypothetical protein BDZ89DRAFT_1055197 [Hymenopellis radicata]|nr:hypothetical protein BDZ89DRAFT_1055197 [Hymenopellis radicata]